MWGRVLRSGLWTAPDRLRSGILVPVVAGRRLMINLLVVVVLLPRDSLNAVGLAPRWTQAPVGSGGPPALVPQPTALVGFSRLSSQARYLLESKHSGVGFLAGLNRSTPRVEYLFALSVIAASGTTIGGSLQAVARFSVVILALVALPLVGHLVKPGRGVSVGLCRPEPWHAGQPDFPSNKPFLGKSPSEPGKLAIRMTRVNCCWDAGESTCFR
jgi:hypothetical protein